MDSQGDALVPLNKEVILGIRDLIKAYREFMGLE